MEADGEGVGAEVEDLEGREGAGEDGASAPEAADAVAGEEEAAQAGAPH